MASVLRAFKRETAGARAHAADRVKRKWHGPETSYDDPAAPAHLGLARRPEKCHRRLDSLAPPAGAALESAAQIAGGAP